MIMDFNDVLALLGFISLSIGLWWVYPPVALIVGGILLMAVGTLRARIAVGRTQKPEQP